MKKEMPRKPRPQKRGRTLESAERSPVPARRAVTAQRQRRCPEWITRRWARAPARAWPPRRQPNRPAKLVKIGRASCRERVCQYVSISVVAVAYKKQTERLTTRQSRHHNHNP